LTGKQFSEEDREAYKELAKMFDFLWGLMSGGLVDANRFHVCHETILAN